MHAPPPLHVHSFALPIRSHASPMLQTVPPQTHSPVVALQVPVAGPPPSLSPSHSALVLQPQYFWLVPAVGLSHSKASAKPPAHSLPQPPQLLLSLSTT